MLRPIFVVLGALLYLASCGRFGFDEAGKVEQDGGSIDAPTIIDASQVDAADPGLLAWYKFDDEPSDGVIDSSASERTGQCGTTCPELAVGQIDGAYDFDGVDQFIEVTDVADLATSSFSIACWVFVRSDRNQAVFSKPFGELNENSWQFEVLGPSSASFTVGGLDFIEGVFAFNQWVHLTGTFDGDEAVLYVDGTAVDTRLRSPNFDGRPLIIGGDLRDTLLVIPLDGLVDDVRVYDRVISASEIAALSAQPE